MYKGMNDGLDDTPKMKLVAACTARLHCASGAVFRHILSKNRSRRVSVA
jgi:hypothetical protein